MQFTDLFPSRSRSLSVGLALVLACSCNGEDTSVDTALDNLDPPKLEFLGATTAEGSDFSPDDDTLVLDCDARVVFHLGPLDSTDQVKNWVLRPPGSCEQDVPCGYVRVTLEDSSGNALLETETPLANVLVDLTGVDWGAVAGVKAQLIQASSLKPYLVEDKPVLASWKLAFAASECPGGIGGAGGETGLGGAAER